MMPVFTGRKRAWPPSTTNTPSFSSPFSRAAAAPGSLSGGLQRVGVHTLPSLSTSRTTTAWMGTASTLRLAGGGDVGGGVQARAQGGRRVLERDRDLEVLGLVRGVGGWRSRPGRGAARDGRGADLGDLALDLRRPPARPPGPRPAGRARRCGCRSRPPCISHLHHGEVGHGHDHGGREALGADHDLALLLREAGDDAVHGRDHGRLLEVVAVARQRRGLLGDRGAAARPRRPAFIFSSASAWSNAWSEISFSACILRAALEGQARDLEVGLRAVERRPARPAPPAADCRSPASKRVESMRASTWPRGRVSPSLTSSSVMRPETLALDVDEALGLDLAGGGDHRDQVAPRRPSGSGRRSGCGGPW